MQKMKNLGNGVSYIGMDDLTLDLFEGQYILPEGVSYNSYLIDDEKIAVLDTVDARCGDAWFEEISAVLGDRTPDFLVVHHLEPDHSGMIAEFIRRYPSVRIVAGAKALQMLPQFLPEDMLLSGDSLCSVAEGDVLDLGSHKLKFISAPMVHWPEVMMSYDLSDGVFYSADAFGKFGALGKCGFYGSEDEEWTCEARRYYFNIVGKYGVQVQALLKKASTLDIKAIRPLHGPLLGSRFDGCDGAEDSLGKYLELYDCWSAYRPETEGIFIAVASIHGGTLAAAEKFAEILRAKGAGRVVVSDLSRSDIAENVEDAFRHSKMVLACASYDGGIFSPMSDFLHRLGAKGYRSRKVALLENGSWAPCAARVMKDKLALMKDVEIVGRTVTVRSRLKSSDIPALEELADAIINA